MSDPSTEPSADLADLLGAPLPPAVAALPAEVLHRLAMQVRVAKARQHQEIDRAVRTALTGVPLPVRGVVRKALLG